MSDSSSVAERLWHLAIPGLVVGSFLGILSLRLSWAPGWGPGKSTECLSRCHSRNVPGRCSEKCCVRDFGKANFESSRCLVALSLDA